MEQDINILESLLHPRLLKTSYKEFIDGNFRSASSSALIHIEDALREKLKLDSNSYWGKKLIDFAFTPRNQNDFELHLNPFSDNIRTDKIIKYFKGVFEYYRNYLAHSNDADISKEQCFRILVIVSDLQSNIKLYT